MEKKLILKSITESSKPNNFRNPNIECPFCDFDALKSERKVLQDLGDSIFVLNKFSTIEKTIQTLFIETNKCNYDFCNYPPSVAINVLKNFFLSYKTLKEMHPDKDIVCFKNYGPHSSGSIQHQHIQLLVLEEPLNQEINPIHLEGDSILSNHSLHTCFSDNPITELVEFNISIKKDDLFSFGKEFDDFCLLLQEAFKFTLDTVTSSNSLNFTFYFLEDKVVIKILPRLHKHSHSHTALFLGYRIHLVPDNLSSFKDSLKKRFLSLKLNTF